MSEITEVKRTTLDGREVVFVKGKRDPSLEPNSEAQATGGTIEYWYSEDYNQFLQIKEYDTDGKLLEFVQAVTVKDSVESDDVFSPVMESK